MNAFKKTQGLKRSSSESTAGWRLQEFHYKVPKDMQRLRFELNVLTPGDFWIDGLELIKTAG